MTKKACQCKVELNHLNSMQLMLMEAMADGRMKDASFYIDVVKDTIKDVGKCTGVNMDSALHHLRNTKEWVEKKEIRPVMRTLQDAYWHTLFLSCRE